MRAVAGHVAFPGVLFGSLLFTHAMLTAGVHETSAAFGTVVLAALAILLLQRLIPHEPSWRWWGAEAPVDLLHMFLSSGAAGAAAKGLMFGTMVAGQTWLSAWIGGTIWPTHWHPFLQLALALLLSDLGAYWVHRASHEWEPLWRFHALHHSSERLAMLSSGRNHPLHTMLSYTVETAPLVLLGAEGHLLALIASFVAVNGMLQHANVAYRFGLWNWLFATADLHRWHHSTVERESKTNYGNNLVVWDVLFGTRVLPAAGTSPRAVGLGEGVAFPTSYLGQLWSPVTYGRIAAGVTSPSSPSRSTTG